MIRPTTIALLAAAGVLAATSIAHAREVYRWTDDSGVLHLSDTPPLATVADTVIVPVAPAQEVSALTVTTSPAQPSPRAAAPAAPPTAAVIQLPSTPSYSVASPVRRNVWWPSVVAIPAPPVSDPSLGRAQLDALAQRGLSGPRRPASINSSVHAQRVARSQSLSTNDP